MRFFKSISTVLTGALLATTAVAAPASTHQMTKRDDVTDRRVAACEAALEKAGARLRARDDVWQGESKGGKGDAELETHGMSDCIGLAVTLDRAEGDDGDDRWLLHYEASGTGELDKVKSAVKDAKDKGATNVQVVVVAPDAATQSPPYRPSLETDIKTVVDAASEIAGTTVTPETHPFTKSAGLKIKGDKTIEPLLDEGDWMDEKQTKILEREFNGEQITNEEYADAYPESDLDDDDDEMDD